MLYLIFAIKLLLFPTYYSTDFDVHKNWMRITNFEDLDKWYYDDYSEWTLDYPPIFAYFEWILAQIVCLYDSSLIDVVRRYIMQKQSLHKNGREIIYFQRLTVLASDFLYIYAVYYVAKKVIQQNPLRRFLMALPFGLLLIDSKIQNISDIHFQYNGMLKALLIFSCYYLQTQQFVKAALTFSVLLCLKHIYIYAAPIFFFVILRQVKLQTLIQVGLTVIGVLCVTFLPFIKHLPQLITRMFPIGRGLVHSYWAPNIWALYCFTDRILGRIYLFIDPQFKRSTDLVAGKVQITPFDVLPQIVTSTTLLLIIIVSLPLWNKILRRKTGNIFKLVALQTLIFYDFGYHTHEKAIMIPIIMLYFTQENIFMFSLINSIALLPLIPSHIEQPFLIIALVLYHILLYVDRPTAISWIEEQLILCGAGIVMFHLILHPIIFGERLEFLPLMMYSIYAGVYNQYYLLKLYRSTLQDQNELQLIQ